MKCYQLLHLLIGRAALIVIAYVVSFHAYAQQGEQVSQEDIKKLSPEELSEEVAQDLSPIATMTFRNIYASPTNVLQFFVNIPFSTWHQNQLLRMNLPFRTNSDNQSTGLGPTSVFNLFTFDLNHGFWGIGPAGNFVPSQGYGPDAFQIGAAGGFVKALSKNVRIGFLSQNFFSEHVAVSTFQPIIFYGFAERWTVGLGTLPLIYSWKQNDFLLATIGFQVGMVMRPGGQPIRVFAEPQYNFGNTPDFIRWSFLAGASFVLFSPDHR